MQGLFKGLLAHLRKYSKPRGTAAERWLRTMLEALVLRVTRMRALGPIHENGAVPQGIALQVQAPLPYTHRPTQSRPLPHTHTPPPPPHHHHLPTPTPPTHTHTPTHCLAASNPACNLETALLYSRRSCVLPASGVHQHPLWVLVHHALPSFSCPSTVLSRYCAVSVLCFPTTVLSRYCDVPLLCCLTIVRSDW